MKRFKYIIIASIGLLLAMTSCSDGEEIQRVLEVEEPAVLLSQAAQEKEVKITIDAGVSFTAAWDGESWGQVVANVNEGVVTIKTTANTTTNPRKASVIVTSEGGLRNSIIRVTQNGDTPLLSVIPDDISFDFMGGETIIEVESNVEWKHMCDVTWAEVRSFNSAGKIIVNVQRNPNSYARSTTITVTAGSSSKEVLVLQNAGLTILLPYLNLVDANVQDMIKFEEDRYSVFVGNPMATRFPIEALTRSGLMPKITYFFSFDRKKINYASFEVNDKFMPDFFSNGEDKGRAYDFMMANNWEYLLTIGESDYYWMDMGALSSHYMIEVDKALSYVRYSEQTAKPDPTDMPTLPAFPYKSDDIAWGSHKDDAKIWEIGNGAEIELDEPQVLHFNVVGAAGSNLYRMREYLYMTADNDLYEMTYVLVSKEITRVFLSTTAGYMLNPKFVTLLEDEGFVYKQMDASAYIYENIGAGLETRIFMTNLPDTGEIIYAAIGQRPTPTGRSGAPKFKSSLAPYVAPAGSGVLRR